MLPKEACVVYKLDHVVIISCRSVTRYLMHSGLKVHIHSCCFMGSVSIKEDFLMS